MVVAYHLRRAVPGLSFHGFLAVDFFFILSGFVIAHAYDKRLEQGMPKLAFFERRMIRLYPMYLLGALIAAAVAITVDEGAPGSNLGTSQLAWAIGLSILFLPNPFSGSIYLNGPAWSLWYELLANLGYALFHRLMHVRVMLGVAAACLAFLAWSALTKDNLDYGFRGREWPWGLARVGFGFLLGTTIYRCREHFSWVPRVNPAVLLVLVALGLSVPQVSGFNGIYSLAFIALLAPLLVIAGSQSEPNANLTGPFGLLGRVSYPIYAIHRPLQWAMLALIPTTGVVQSVALSILFLAAVFLACLFLERRFERPARGWLSRLSRARLGSSEIAAAP